MARGELILGEYFFASSIHRVSTVCITILLLNRSGQRTPDHPGATELIWHAARAQNSMEWLYSPPAGLSKIERMWARRFVHLLLLWDLWILEEEAWGLVRHHRDAGDLGESVCVWLPVYLLEQTISLQTLEDSQMNKNTLRMMTEPWIKTHGKSTVTAEKHRPVYCMYTLFKQVYICVLCYFYSSPELISLILSRDSSPGNENSVIIHSNVAFSSVKLKWEFFKEYSLNSFEWTVNVVHTTSALNSKMFWKHTVLCDEPKGHSKNAKLHSNWHSDSNMTYCHNNLICDTIWPQGAVKLHFSFHWHSLICMRMLQTGNARSCEKFSYFAAFKSSSLVNSDQRTCNHMKLRYTEIIKLWRTNQL